jgi:hypothetical protein
MPTASTSKRGGKRAGAGRKYLGTEARTERLNYKVTLTTRRIIEALARLNKTTVYGVLVDALESYAADCIDGGLPGLADELRRAAEIKKPCDSIR